MFAISAFRLNFTFGTFLIKNWNVDDPCGHIQCCCGLSAFLSLIPG